MSPVPTNPRAHDVAGLVDKVSNMGSWPPTAAFKTAFRADGVCFNLKDPGLQSADAMAVQIAGARSHGVWANVWHPVPPAGADGALLAFQISDQIAHIDAALIALGQSSSAWATWARLGKVDLAWLNFEGFTIAQWRAFLWGKPAAGGTPKAKGWRGSGGVRGSTDGYRPGLTSGAIDQPFQDGSVCPHAELLEARFMLAVEGFYGPTAQWPDMTPADHPQAMIDRRDGARSDGTIHPDEAYPAAQLVGCYAADLGTVVGPPPEPILIRSGLLFTVDAADRAGII